MAVGAARLNGAPACRCGCACRWVLRVWACGWWWWWCITHLIPAARAQQAVHDGLVAQRDRVDGRAEERDAFRRQPPTGFRPMTSLHRAGGSPARRQGAGNSPALLLQQPSSAFVARREPASKTHRLTRVVLYFVALHTLHTLCALKRVVSVGPARLPVRMAATAQLAAPGSYLGM